MNKQRHRKKQAHVHVDEHGILHKCYHKCRSTIFSAGFWIGVTISYPLEHALWEDGIPYVTAKVLALL